jgi:hypothetical protein
MDDGKLLNKNTLAVGVVDDMPALICPPSFGVLLSLVFEREYAFLIRLGVM